MIQKQTGRAGGSPDANSAPSNDDGTGGKLPFEIHLDIEQRCLFVVMRGLWTPAIFDAYADALTRAEEAMLGLQGTTYTLVDGRSFPVQPPEIQERFVPLVLSFRLPATRRTAIIVPEPIERVQARAISEIVNARHFRTMESAREWLFSDEA